MQADEQGWNAEDYARNDSAQRQWAAELIEQLSLTGTEHLLDIGCGNGAITAALAARLPRGRVLGIDASGEMIRLAAGTYPQPAHPNVSFLQMDATAIDLPGKFDVAFSNAVLHWVADQPAVLRGVRSCLKPGGRVLFQMGGRGNAAEILRIVDFLAARQPWRRRLQGFVPPYHFHGPEEYTGWLLGCGFTPLRVALIPKDMRHRGPEALKGWLRTTWFPYTDRLPPELRERFLDEIVAAHLAKVPLDSEGWTHVAMVRLQVEAVAS